jgi:hypothetical protein
MIPGYDGMMQVSKISGRDMLTEQVYCLFPEPPQDLDPIRTTNCCKLDSTLCIETSKELRTRLAEAVYEEYADQSLTKQLVTCNMDTAYPPIRTGACASAHRRSKTCN